MLFMKSSKSSKSSIHIEDILNFLSEGHMQTKTNCQTMYEWCINICYLKGMYSWITAKNAGERLIACKVHEIIGIDRAMQEKWFKEVENRLNRASK